MEKEDICIRGIGKLKLLENNLISITIGWEKPTKNLKTGKPQIDYKKRTIQITSSGEYYADFPGLLGSIV